MTSTYLKSAMYLGYFSTVVYLLLLFGDTFLGLPIMGVAAVFFAWPFLQKNIKPIQLKFPLVWILFLSGCGISLVFTHSLPLSIQFIFPLLFSALFFFWSTTVAPKERVVVLLGILGAGLLVVATAVFFFFFPDLGIGLQGRNLVFSNFGHNHLTALLLLLAPLSWGLYLKSTSDELLKPFSRCLVGLAIFLTVVVPLTFGRVAVVIMILQLALVLVAIKKNTHFLEVKTIKITQTTITKILVVLFGCGLFLLVVSSLPAKATTILCSRLSQVVKVCKPLTEEKRLEYWQQAITAVQKFPLAGYGPGTFELISTRYRQKPDSYSAFAHNEFLQKYAELGLLGGTLFLLLIFTLLKVSLRLFLKGSKQDFLRPFLQIAVLGISVNSLFDFDWNFIGIFCLFLLFVGFLIPPNSNEKNNVPLTKKITQVVVFTSTTILVGLTLCYVLIEIFIAQKKYDRAVAIFPYFVAHSKLFVLQAPSLSVDRVVEVFRYHPKIFQDYFYAYDYTPNLFNQLKTTDPWAHYYYEKELQYYLKSGDQDNAYASALRIRDHIQQFEQSAGYEFDYFRKVELSKLIMVSGSNAFRQKEYHRAGTLFKAAADLNGYEFGDKEPPFTDATLFSAEMNTFVDEILKIDPTYYGPYGERYGTFLLKAIRFQLNGTVTGNFAKLVPYTVKISPWKWNQMAEVLMVGLNDQLKAREVAQVVHTSDDTQLAVVATTFSKLIENQAAYDTTINDVNAGLRRELALRLARHAQSQKTAQPNESTNWKDFYTLALQLDQPAVEEQGLLLENF